MGEVDDALHWHDGAQHVGDMRDGDQLGAVTQKLFEGLHTEFALISDRCDFQHQSFFIAHHLPRHDVGMVFHLGDDNFVAGVERTPPMGCGNQIDRFGGVPGENDFLAAFRIEKGLNLIARAFIGIGRAFAQIVSPAMHIGVFGLIDGAHGIDHLARFLGRRRAV